jgi:hypothetical protein
MDAKTYIHKQIASMHSMVDDVLGGMTDAHLTWTPPGTANLIGLTVLHMLSGEDYFISLISGRTQLWKSQGWNEKFNIATPPDYGEDWSVYLGATLSVDKLLAYRDAVRSETLAYLDRLTADELDRTVKLFTDKDPVADVLVLIVSHMLGHTGEIAALKGVQGIKGLPY